MMCQNKDFRKAKSHGYTLEGTTVESWRQVGDEILCVGGVMKSKISPKLVREVRNAYTKYKTDGGKLDEIEL